MLIGRGLLILLGAVTLSLAGCGDGSATIPDDGMDDMLAQSMESTPFIVDGIEAPEMTAAAETKLAADDRIVGVIIGEQPRAYSITAMSDMAAHVVNDVVGDTAVSITYCDRTDCTRAFTFDTSGNAIHLSTGGFMNGEMALRLDQEMYSQTSPDIPLQDHEFEVTTWGEWIQKHPNSLVFDGQP